MKILGIETATEICSVGITENGKVIAEDSIDRRNAHSEALVPMILDVAKSAGLTLSGIDGVAVSKGPGSFTGLRIGMSAAKGLVFALQKPFAAVPTFEAVTFAYFSASSNAEAVFALDAKQGEFYVLYCKRQDALEFSVPMPNVMPAERLRELLRAHPRATLVTDIQKTGNFAQLEKRRVEDFKRFCRGGAVARAGEERIARGLTDSADDAEPAYLKDFVVKK